MKTITPLIEIQVESDYQKLCRYNAALEQENKQLKLDKLALEQRFFDMTAEKSEQ